jgi:pimeloyl-ACP methyl ester carboxylesterase
MRFPRNERDVQAAMLTLVKQGWGHSTPVFRDVFTNMFIPNANGEERRYFNEMQRASASPDTAAAYLESIYVLDVRNVATQVRAPTLVIHRRGDRAIPFKGGAALAALIPGAEFLPLEGDRHWLLLDETGVPALVDAVEEFVRGAHGAAPRLGVASDGETALAAGSFSDAQLSPREKDVLHLVTQG